MARKSERLGVSSIAFVQSLDRSQSFCREVIAWRCLSHPNILEFLGATLEGGHSVVSPWMKNGNIIQFLRKNPQANPLKLVCPISNQYTSLPTPATVGRRCTRSSASSQHGSGTLRRQRGKKSGTVSATALSLV